MEWLNNILRNLEGLFTDATEYASEPQSGVLSSNLSAIGLACRTDIRLEMDIHEPEAGEETSFLTYWTQLSSDFGSV